MIHSIDIISKVTTINKDIDLYVKDNSILDYIHDLFNLNFSLPTKFGKTNLNMTHGSDLGDNFFAFKKHVRCFYKKIGNSWIAFKGISIIYPLEKKNEPSVLYNSSESDEIKHFAEMEHELPYGMTLNACLEDFNSPLQFINDYYLSKQTIPLVPIPLAVFEFKEDLSDIIQNKKFIYDEAHESTKPLLKDYFFNQPIGMYVYLLNSSPVRIGHLSTIKDTLSSVIQTHTVEMFKTMLELGYIPCKLGNIISHENSFTWGKNKGMCIAPWNITIDGAILDFNSVKHINTYLSEKEARYDIQLSLQWLVKLIVSFDSKYSYLLPRIKYNWIDQNKALYNESLVYIHQILFSYFKDKLDFNKIHPFINRFFTISLEKDNLRLL